MSTSFDTDSFEDLSSFEDYLKFRLFKEWSSGIRVSGEVFVLCSHCHKIFFEDELHPGTCGNCGAPR